MTINGSHIHVVKVTFANGDHLTTRINGTEDEVKAYYLGQLFNIGMNGDDDMQKAVAVEFLKPSDE